jgi:endonuclease/exonuclease/phosphatase family metal-dependent hydrolase
MQIRNVGLVTLPVILALAAAPAWGQSAPAAPKAAPAQQATDAPKSGSAPKTGSAPKSAEPAGDEAPAKGKKKEVRPAGYWFGVEKAPEKKQGTIRIAAYNVENLFDPVDDPALSGEYDDAKMVTKPTRVQAIADEIKRLDADVLCVEEIESMEALTWFRDTYLKDMGYAHLYSEDVGYYRGVEQACLSRFPIKAHATFVTEDLSDMDAKRDGEGWAGKKPEQGQKFQRSPLKLEIDVNGWPLTVYSVHLKAGGKEFEFQRESEALQLVDFVNKDLAANPDANIAVMGDFNATPSMKAIKAMSEGGLRSAYDFRAVKKGNTKDLYTTHDSGRAIDYIYMSKGLAADMTDGGFFVLSTMHPPSDYDWKTDPEKEKVPAGYASDHCPVAIDVTPKDAKPADAKPAAAKPASETK